VSERFGVRC